MRFVATMVELRAPGELPLTKMQLYAGYLALVELLDMDDVARRLVCSRTSVDNHVRELARRVGCENVKALRRRLSLLLWDRAA